MPEVDTAERGSPLDMEASYCILRAGLPVLVCSSILRRLGASSGKNKR